MGYSIEIYVPEWDRKHPQCIYGAEYPFQAFTEGQKVFIVETPMGSPFGYVILSVEHVVTRDHHKVMLWVKEATAP